MGVTGFDVSVREETYALRGASRPRYQGSTFLNAYVMHMLAADSVISEVAGKDEAWQEHIREDGASDTQPWETEEEFSGIFEGAFVSA